MGRMCDGLLYVFITFCFFHGTKFDRVTPSGHLQPLGSHRPAEGTVKSLDVVPEPHDFFHSYVLPGKPVIFKGAGKISKGFHLWTDDYLRENHGSAQVRVDYSKKENRARSADEMSLAEFLAIYNTSNRYLVDTLPRSLWSEYSLLSCISCGGYTRGLQLIATYLGYLKIYDAAVTTDLEFASFSEMVVAILSNYFLVADWSERQDAVLWFSSGGTKSFLHIDTVENINCMLSGQKDWFFVNLEHSKSIEIDHGESDYCSVDVDKVDMYKYPSLQHIPWWSAHIEAGDCMYIPYGWAHQVRSHGRNIAVNIWWTPFKTFNTTDCEVKKQQGDLPLSLSKFNFTAGEQLRFQILQVVEQHGGEVVYEQISPLVVSEHTGERLITKERFSLLDTDGDGRATGHEIEALETRVVEEAVGGTPPGEVNVRGKSQHRNERVQSLLASVERQPPEVEEFLLREDKSLEDIGQFVKGPLFNNLPQPLKGYIQETQNLMAEEHLAESFGLDTKREEL